MTTAATINGSVYRSGDDYEACLWLEVDGAQIDDESYGTGPTPYSAVTQAVGSIDYSAIEAK